MDLEEWKSSKSSNLSDLGGAGTGEGLFWNIMMGALLGMLLSIFSVTAASMLRWAKTMQKAKRAEFRADWNRSMAMRGEDFAMIGNT